jgi:Tol biopolymer transport system component
MPIAMVIGLFLCSQSAYANPDRHWRSASSEHFIVHYPAGTELFAQRVLATGERAYARLSKEFNHELRKKVEVAVRDDSDSANGSASATPFARINVNTVAPDSLSALATHDDWVDVLVTHELTHVISLDISHGIPELGNFVLGLGGLGKIWAPNQFAPRWLVEGIATHEESRYTSEGRYRSALFDAFVRNAVLEGRFPRLDQISSEVRIFPHGSGAYLYGLHFVRFLSDRYGQERLTETFHDYGSRVIPFGYGRVFSRAFGATMEQLWLAFEEDMHQRFFAQAREIRASRLRQGRRLTFGASGASSGNHIREPVWAPDGKSLFYFQDPSHRDGGIYRIKPESLRLREGLGTGNEGATVGAKAVFKPLPGSTGIDWIAGREGAFVFSQVVLYDRRYSWGDLYMWDGQKGSRPKPITFGMRTRDPDVSPSGDSVVFVRNDVGQSRLAFVDLRTHDVSEIAAEDSNQVVYDPSFSPDGEKVAYAMWLPGGYRDLYVYDRALQQNRRLTFGRQSVSGPVFSPDGRHILFSSDWGGVFNLWAIDLQENELYQVSNVIGGALQPAISPDGKKIAYLGIGSDGVDLWLMPFDRTQWEKKEPFEAQPQPSPWLGGSDDLPEIRQAMLHSRRYRAIRTLYPRTLSSSSAGLQLGAALAAYQFGLSGADVLGFHRWGASMAYLPSLRRANVDLAYSWRRYVVGFDFRFSRGAREIDRGFLRWNIDRQPNALGKLSTSEYFQTGFLERYTTFDADLGAPIFSAAVYSAWMSLSYRFGFYENLDAKIWDPDPNAPSPQLPDDGKVGRVELRFSLSNRRSSRFGFYDERGRNLSVAVGLYDRILGSDYADVSLVGRYNEFFSMPWRGHQVLIFGVQGGLAGQNRYPTAFEVGGPRPETDLVRAVGYRLSSQSSGNLRGYPAGAFRGRYFGVATLEYFAPLVDIEKGYSMLPLYLSRVLVGGFTDWGMAGAEPLRLKDYVGSVGGSMIFQLRVGHREMVQLFLQVAHGLDRDRGSDTFNAFVSTGF